MAGGGVPIIMLIVLTVVCTGLVYFVYGRAQELIDVSVLAILLCSIPAFTVAFAYGLLGESLTPHVLVGGAIIFAGIVVIAAEKEAAPDAAAALAGVPLDTSAGR